MIHRIPGSLSLEDTNALMETLIVTIKSYAQSITIHAEFESVFSPADTVFHFIKKSVKTIDPDLVTLRRLDSLGCIIKSMFTIDQTAGPSQIRM